MQELLVYLHSATDLSRLYFYQKTARDLSQKYKKTQLSLGFFTL